MVEYFQEVVELNGAMYRRSTRIETGVGINNLKSYSMFYAVQRVSYNGEYFWYSLNPAFHRKVIENINGLLKEKNEH